MATSPDRVRAALQVVAHAAAAEVSLVAQEASQEPATMRAALFAAAPLIVADYTAGSGALALDWYEDLRGESRVRETFTPSLLALVTEDDVKAVVAETTKTLHEIEQGIQREVDEAVAAAEAVSMLADKVEQQVTDGFRDTITANVTVDPAAAGWRRFARPEACKFCKMLAARGAIYKEATARFAAHGAVMGDGRKGGNCMCIAGPEFGEAPEATPMQYVASQKRRTPKQRADLRDYLNKNFPDSPG